MLVHDVMTCPAVTVRPETSVEQAVLVLDEHKLTSMPVVDDAGHLVGVVSEVDVLRDSIPPGRRVHERLVEIAASPFQRQVGDVMTDLPASVSTDQDVARALEILVSTQVKSLPVVRFGRVVGMLSRRDVIAVLARTDGWIDAQVDGSRLPEVVDVTMGRST